MKLARVADFAVGMIDDLPPTHHIDEWIAKSCAPAPQTVKSSKDTAGQSSTTRRGTTQTQEQERTEEEKEDSSNSSSTISGEDEERTKTETEEEDPFKEHPAQSEKFYSWGRIEKSS